MSMGLELITTATVSEHGVIEPTFCVPIGHDRQWPSYTSGQLKYFFALAGKRVRVTIEVLEDEEDKIDGM